MKKILTILASLALSIQMLPIHANTFIQVTDASLSFKEKKIKENAIALRGENINIEYSITLLDIAENENYILSILDNGGYIISSEEKLAISEMSTTENSNPYKDVMNYSLLYAGPYNCYYKTVNGYKNVYTHTILDLVDAAEIKSINDLFLEEEPYVPKTRYFPYKGISESRMQTYNWINRDNNCGPISAAILIAYYDDYINNQLVPDSIRPRNSSSGTALINAMTRSTTSPTATMPIHVATGLNTFMNNYSSTTSYMATSNNFSTWGQVKKNCEASLPICVGMINAPSYGNHWVTVYQIRENGENKGFYKCVDNWGDYKKEIETRWTIGYARLYKT